MVRTLVLLQNAWSRKPRKTWSYTLWVQALRRSRSGQRLSRIFEAWSLDHVLFANTTPRIGLTSSAKLPPDGDYVASLFFGYGPRVVVACGLQAEEIAREWWAGPLLCLPHPASRTLTNSLLGRAKALLYGSEPFGQRLALRQGRSEITAETLLT